MKKVIPLPQKRSEVSAAESTTTIDTTESTTDALIVPIASPKERDNAAPSSSSSSSSSFDPSSIMARRGYFHSLPIGIPLCYKGNDLSTGSWWFVVSSALSCIIPCIPLADIWHAFFHIPENSRLPALDLSITWVLLIVMGIFFSLGSLAFARCFEEPPLSPCFASVSLLRNDEILAAWLFLLGSFPSVPYIVVFLISEPINYQYIAGFVCAVLFVVASSVFVYATYISGEGDEKKRSKVMKRYFIYMLGDHPYVRFHFSTDFLVASWVLLLCTFVWALGSLVLLIAESFTRNDRLIYVYATSFADSFFFAIGCAHFVAGSYEPEDVVLYKSHLQSLFEEKKGGGESSSSTSSMSGEGGGGGGGGGAAGGGSNSSSNSNSNMRSPLRLSVDPPMNNESTTNERSPILTLEKKQHEEEEDLEAFGARGGEDGEP